MKMTITRWSLGKVQAQRRFPLHLPSATGDQVILCSPCLDSPCVALLCLALTICLVLDTNGILVWRMFADGGRGALATSSAIPVIEQGESEVAIYSWCTNACTSAFSCIQIHTLVGSQHCSYLLPTVTKGGRPTAAAKAAMAKLTASENPGVAAALAAVKSAQDFLAAAIAVANPDPLEHAQTGKPQLFYSEWWSSYNLAHTMLLRIQFLFLLMHAICLIQPPPSSW